MEPKHDRDTAISELSPRGRRYIVWFNYHRRVFTRFDEWNFSEVLL